MFRIAAAALLVLVAGRAHAQGGPGPVGDPEAGQRSFGKCRACHQVGETAKNGIGPQLNGLFGHTAGSVPGYTYTAANKDSGITWSPATFADYIKDPKARIPGTKMVFAGLKDDKEVADLTAYLQAFDAAGKKAGS